MYEQFTLAVAGEVYIVKANDQRFTDNSWHVNATISLD